jgi:hypothetical protein
MTAGQKKTKRAAKPRAAPHAPALATLIDLLRSGENDAARITAVDAPFDRPPLPVLKSR